MIVLTIRWQAHGSGETLDAQLAYERGWSKVHAIREPLAVGDDEHASESVEYQKLKCGRSVPNTADRIAERYNEPVTCKTCERD